MMTVRAGRLARRMGALFAPVLATALAVPGFALAQGDGSESDLPPAGTRSTFDFVFSKKVDNAYVYDLPTSIEGVVQKLRSLGAGEPITLLVPMGRSVQRLTTDLKDPRVVITLPTDPRRPTSGDLPPQVKHRLFIGFGEKSDQLEVISYNEGAARYEFQVVRHLSDPAKQEVIYAPRAFCKSCHFAGEPMFPRNPWEETTAFPATARAVERERGSNAPYHGIPIAQPNNNAYEFDRLTDAGADLLAWQKLWRQGCDATAGQGEDPLVSQAPVRCRAGVLKLAFRSMFDFWVPTDSPDYAALKGALQPAARAVFGPELAFPLADLESRNPLAVEGGFVPGTGTGTGTGVVGTGSGDLRALKDRGTVPASFDPLSADPTREDPLMFHPWRTPAPSTYGYPKYSALVDRPKIRKSDADGTLNEFVEWTGSELLVDYDFWASLFDANAAGDARYAKLDAVAQSLVDQALAGAGPDAAVLRRKPFSATRFASAAARVLSLPELRGCCDHAATLPEAKVDSESDLVIGGGGDLNETEKVVAKKLTDYCWPCHKPSAGEIGFFTGDFTKIDKALAKRILTKLDWERCTSVGNEMPPAGPRRQRVCAASDDRRQIIETVRTRYFPGVEDPCAPEHTRTPPREWNALCAPPTPPP
jgi:hypothetical protein